MATPIDNSTFTPSDSTATHGVHAQHHEELARISANVFNIVNEGASTSGTAAANTTAIRSALTKASTTSNGIVDVPPGIFSYDGALTVPAGVTLSGRGPGSVLRCVNVTADLTTGEKSAVTIGRGLNARVRDLKLDGASTCETGIEISGAGDGQVFGVGVRDVEITGFTVAGVKIRGGYRLVFDRCDIHANGKGVWIPGTGLYLAALGQFDFRSCWIRDNTAEGFYAQAGAPYFFRGGNVENNGTYGFRFDPSASGQIIAPVGVFGVHIEANGTLGLLAHDFTQGIACVGCNFVASAIQPKAWQLDGGGGGNHYFAGNTQQGHGTVSSDATTNSLILPGKILSESYPTRGASPRGPLNVIAYSASMTPDGSLGENFQTTANNGTAFTINNPTNVASGQVLRIQIRNSSAGALGVATWGTKYKLAGAWVQPAAFNNRSIQFVYDAANDLYYESSRTAADTPN